MALCIHNGTVLKENMGLYIHKGPTRKFSVALCVRKEASGNFRATLCMHNGATEGLWVHLCTRKVPAWRVKPPLQVRDGSKAFGGNFASFAFFAVPITRCGTLNDAPVEIVVARKRRGAVGCRAL